MRRSIVLCTLLLSMVYCAPPAATAPDIDAIRSSIGAENAKFVEAIDSGDAAAASARYTEDAVTMPPGQPSVKGKQAIQEGIAARIAAASLGGLKLTTSDVTVQGDLAIEEGTYSVEAGASTNNGKFLNVWRRQADGSWKVHRSIWNLDTIPEPGGAGEPADDAQK